ncbi:PROTEASOME REGULATORY SUBUNIT YTA6 OF THE AAA FAMILY OF ATPASES [Encephalitozoon cuniculi GB-M1]|uniref:PROTEASOME REGULATORY SUBUNIT YTA6 OF THE AAA FAMILY OF ATPASES n=2 Tax=Encephalitozoon cuniculi TaxID=6035 RepID=Q8SQW9_ENCCU|nr:AAA family ATPase [Encephalitozoon cuniculi GB-M1]AGE94883.1 proteasome regulatory subunit YTA6 [Encephalitozoon cuniculi]KMV65042.1 AAA family ATPase [Encephalitozoon cuniculi EcunIII-L]UYI26287.1 AAA ATPase [Encephalitozoon cuniculi]CAD25994.1 PROTEASOME REGULATORY SUBUNIT YTA6 OF THE AAA FAMILY OF ATPASES [Encephalitozoon cuniculi GB-M1]
MRDLETSKSYKVDKKTNEDEEEYEEMRDRTKKNKPEGKRKNINNEILGALIYRKILRDYGIKQKKTNKNSKPTKSRDVIYLVVIVFVIAYVIYKVISSGDRYSEQPDKGREEKTESGERPSFQEGSSFENVSYFGKEDLMIHVISQVTKIVNLLRTTPEKDLHKSIETTQRNFLFHGPPGTGKTLFMKKLIYLVDLNIKFLKMRNEMGEEEFERMDHNEKLIRAKEMESLTRITFVTPSSLNNKYVGETEKNIRSLFQSANDGKYWASFVFIDEVDVFFSKRSDRSQDYTLKAQTEFLNTIGGACDKVNSTVFLFGATNLYDTLDDAFKRRFSGVYEFSPPSDEERLEILEQYLGDCKKEITSRYADLVRLTSGMVQSRIVDILKKISFSNDGSMEGIDWKDLRKAFEDADPKKKGTDGSDVNVVESLKKFYFLEPKPKPKKRDIEILISER